MTEDKSLFAPGAGKLLFMDKNVNNFFRRTTILYGTSNTGKNVILTNLLDILRPRIPNVICISPTNQLNNDFDGILPRRCVISNVDAKYLHSMLERQKMAVGVYNKANDLKILEGLARKTGDSACIDDATRVRRRALACIDGIEKSQDLTYAEKFEQKDDIQEKLKLRLIDIFKQAIVRERAHLATQKLTDDERYSLKYLFFNPSMLLIMDDCAAQIEKWGKDPIIGEIFFNGRHYWFTSIYTMQDDKKLPTDIRKNTFTSFFTDASPAVSFFSNVKSNGITKAMQKKAEAIIEFVFKEPGNGSPNYKKLVYSRMDTTDKLRYYIADRLPPIKFGSAALWKLCDGIPTNGDSSAIDKSNKFFTAFAP